MYYVLCAIRDDFFGSFGSTSYDPPSYSRPSGGGGYSSHTPSSSSSSTIHSDSHFFGKHSAFSSSGGSSVDRPSDKVSSFGAASGSSRGGGDGRGHSTWSTPGSSGDAQQRFSSAKSISSDQYFGRESGNDQVSCRVTDL